MPSRSITFNPDTGVPYGANLTIYGGSNFNTTFNITDDANTNFNLTSYSGSAAISKSVSIGATLGITTTFTVGITSAIGGKLEISLGLKEEIKKKKMVVFNYEVVDNNENTLSMGNKILNNHSNANKIQVYHLKKSTKCIGSFLQKRHAKTFKDRLERVIHKYFYANDLIDIGWAAKSKSRSRIYQGFFTQEDYNKLS